MRTKAVARWLLDHRWSYLLINRLRLFNRVLRVAYSLPERVALQCAVARYPGWAGLVKQAYDAVRADESGPWILNIMIASGALTICHTPASGTTTAIIAALEELSETSCAWCGAPAEPSQSGLTMAICGRCFLDSSCMGTPLPRLAV